jgi:hypothetical protein
VGEVPLLRAVAVHHVDLGIAVAAAAVAIVFIAAPTPSSAPGFPELVALSHEVSERPHGYARAASRKWL